MYYQVYLLMINICQCDECISSFGVVTFRLLFGVSGGALQRPLPKRKQPTLFPLCLYQEQETFFRYRLGR